MRLLRAPRAAQAQRRRALSTQGEGQSSSGSDEHAGYWWLAWTWSNLLFACRNCNQAPYKLDKFPLAVGSMALSPEEAAPGGEQPLLIDPAAEDAADHIEFVEDRHGSAPRWLPRPRGGSERGRQTIAVCGLDRPDLLTLYGLHVDKEVRPLADRIERASLSEDGDAVRSEWAGAVLRLLSPTQVFVALARDALVALVAPAIRERWALDLPGDR